ncbi:MAG: hypothetical protein GDA38_06970 [Hormoscilla sp. SP12CHS1]|nr:hypothetical protein [Hormoscilla sp. SP12CHS1]
MSDRELQQIQDLQFADLEAANALLKEFIIANLDFQVETVQIRPLAVSLNSLNGLITTADGTKYFFKTHVEPQSIINEYYNSTILAEAGYPVIQPIHSSTEWGKQLLIYEFFETPSMFNVIRDLEMGRRTDADQVISIQEKADAQLWEIYLQTLQPLEKAEHARFFAERSPIHQLFYHRLTGGRFANFYQGTDLFLPGGKINYNSLASMQWNINGIQYQDTLGQLVQQAIGLLEPSRTRLRAEKSVSIVGHGDAHNGNLFIDVDLGSMVYFDPAFAGRHSPLLDLIKPLFHNVFAIWMYYPREIAESLSIRWEIKGDTMMVEHDFVPSPVRVALLLSKLERVLKPLLGELSSRCMLEENWREYLKLALFCCPFLTMNLSDVKKFPPEITLLGLAMSVEMGSTSSGSMKSLLDTELGS